MRTRLIAVTALTAMAMLAGPLPSAHASAVFAAVVAGKCELTAPIGFPVTGGNKGALIPTTCSFGSAAVKTPTATKPTVLIAKQQDVNKNPGAKPKVIDIVCVLPGGPCNGGGTITAVVGPSDLGGPWCGHSAGTFAGGFGNVALAGTYISAGTALILNGTITHGLQSGPFVGAVDAATDAQKPVSVPPFAGNSCAASTAHSFYVVGGLVGAKVGPVGNPFGK